MIKLPTKVGKIMKRLREKGFECYAVGGCVRDSVIGLAPLDWDLATDAQLKDLQEIFPEAKVISPELSVVRIDYDSETQEDEEDLIVDIASMRQEVSYDSSRKPDKVEFTNDIELDMKRRDFTVNAMADNTERAIVDPYGGLEDIKKRLIRTVGNPKERFDEDPLRMLRAIRFAAELNFDLHKETYEAIAERAVLLGRLSRDRIRSEFVRTISAPHAGKGLKMLVACGFLPYIIGPETANKLSRGEFADMETLAERIDLTQTVEDRRLGMFYCCLNKKRAEAAIDYMLFDNKRKQHLIDGVYLSETLYFMTNKHDLKDFLAHYGYERYEYVHNLSKAQVIVFEAPDIKVKNRIYMYKDIVENKEPVYIEDLAINGQDLIDNGIAQGEKVGEILLMLTDMVHRKPSDNNKEDLLNHARTFSKNKVKAAFRKVKWLR